MAQLPSLPLFTDAFIADTLDLDAEVTGAYLMLLMVAWRSPDCELPDDDDKLARFARCSKSRWKKIKPNVLKFFENNKKNGTFFQKRLKKEYERALRSLETKRENGRRGGRPKSLENKDTDKAIGSNSDIDSDNREDNLNITESKAPNPNPNPNLKNPPLGPPKKVDKSKGARLDPDWWPDGADRKYANDKGLTDLDVDREAEKFRNYWLAKAGQSARKVDWGLTWRNWCLNATEDVSRNQSPPKKPMRLINRSEVEIVGDDWRTEEEKKRG
jgi:uncharacterized protein YdaU (DUF1376 family)